MVRLVHKGEIYLRVKVPGLRIASAYHQTHQQGVEEGEDSPHADACQHSKQEKLPELCDEDGAHIGGLAEDSDGKQQVTAIDLVGEPAHLCSCAKETWLRH